ncbi:MAG: LysR family transcriptional regulator [Bacteriovorax sp.]|nr:LysR family transcriptional regulator [Bacteriovorax sp.]
MSDSPDLNYLKYFYYVAKLGGFTKAAVFLNVQQPVVSRAVKLLEQSLGCHLLERQKKRVILTHQGNKVFDQCETIFSSVEKIPDILQNFDKNESYIFSFVSSDSLSYGILEKVILLLKKDYPNIIFQHQSGSIVGFIDQILNGQVEMGFFFNIPKLPNGLVKTKITPVDFHYVIKKSVSKNKDIQNSFIATISTSHESADDLPLFKKYKSQHKEAKVSIISNSSVTRKAMILNGMGVTILPQFMIENDLSKSYLEILGSPEKLTLYVVERQLSYRTSLKTKLISLVKEIV